MRWISALILSGTAVILAPCTAAGQTVVGEVVEAGTAQPLVGAFVVLEDEAGEQQAAVLAGDEGRFMLRAPSAGTYRMVARLIGYADSPAEALTLGEGETVRRTITVPVQAVSLGAITAQVGKRCLRRPRGSDETARLWEEARKALEITSWGENQAALRFRITEHQRELDATSLRVLDIREGTRSGYYDTSPYRSISADSLHRYGYVQQVGEKQWDYLGPDAQVLLSESFLDSHCFRVAAGTDPERVGLAFEPILGRDLPDIEGTLWLERATAELKRLDFDYVDVPSALGDWDQVGGTVEFERLATGMWIVRRWSIRMPLEARQVGGFGSTRGELELASLLEEGAEVGAVWTASGELLAKAEGAALYGTVTDSVTGEPLMGATVALLPTDRRTTTGPEGTFRLTALPEGAFDVRVSHPELERLGGEPVVRSVQLAAGRAARLSAGISLAARAAELCADQGLRDPILLYGAVRDPADEQPVAGAVVRVAGPGTGRQVLADSAGAYALCIERSDSVAVAAVGPGEMMQPGTAAGARPVDLSGVLARADLTLSPASLARATGRSAAPRGSLIGAVLRREDGEPVTGAMISLSDASGRTVYSAATDENGRFRYVDGGSAEAAYTLEVEHIAYGTTSQEVALTPDEQVVVEVQLSERAIALEPIVVTQRRRGRLVDVGFYDRREEGAGVYVDRIEIQKRKPTRITDMLRGRPGVKVVRLAGGMMADIRVPGTRRIDGSDCQPAIYLDGVLVRDGGRPRSSGPGVDPAQLSELAPPEELEGIEVYTNPAGIPPRYGGSNSDCGVVLLWTRHQ